MPKVDLSRKDLFTLAGIDDPGDAALADLLSLVKGEIDNSDGDRLKIELNDTNRPDLWCTEGIARALRCHARGPEKHLSSANRTDLEIRVDGSLEEVRPFVAAFTACGWAPDEKGLESLIQVQEKLASSFGRNRKTAAAGFYRLDEIVFPVKYRGASPDTRYVPLGEDGEMSLREVLGKTDTGREYAHILEGASVYPVIEDSSGGILSFPPILNSRGTGRVRPGDSNLFCEVTGTDWNTVQLMATILACNLEDRGAVITPIRVVYPDGHPGRTGLCPVRFADGMTATMDDIESILGVKLEPGEVADALRAMDYPEVRIDGNSVTGVMPPYRHDGIHMADMVEDIAVSLGYGSFEPLLPGGFTRGRSSPLADLADAVRLLMVGAGFEEILRPVLTGMEKAAVRTRAPEPPVALANPMTAEYGVVRNSLVPGLLEVESTSAYAWYPHRIFEVGEVLRADDEGVCATEIFLAGVVCGNEANFGDVHSVLGHLCLARDVTLELKPGDDPRFVPGRCAGIVMDGRDSGVVGEVHPAVLEAWGITRPVAAFEIRLDSLGG